MDMASLFDGIGGFPLAGIRNGIEPIWASEIEPFPIKVTEQRFQNMKHYGDITKINGATVEPVDIITFGSPCQDLSVAGKRAGLEGSRSGLFMEAIRIIKEMREATFELTPRYAVWENVPGAFSSNKGEDFRAVIEELCKIADETVIIPQPPKGKWGGAGAIMGDGWSLAWRILDAQFWGVPQRRRRIFLIIDFGGDTAPQILFELESLSRDFAQSREARERTSSNAERSLGETGGNQLTLAKVASTLRAGAGAPKHQSDFIGRLVLDDQGGNIMGISEDVVGTLRAEAHGNLPIVLTPAKGYRMSAFGEYADDDCASTLKARDYKDATDLVVFAVENHPNDSRVGLREDNTIQTLTSRMGTGGGNVPMVMSHSVDCRNLNETKELSGTLQSKATGGYSLNYQNPIRKGYLVRRLTPLECERLQGFPDSWTNTNGACDTARYKALGNSVAVPCVEFVIQRIARILQEGRKAA